MPSPSSRLLRRTAVAIGAVGLIATAGAVPALASAGASHAAAKGQPAVTSGSRYLALGDSVSFGYREDNAIPAPDYSKPKQLIGFPEDVAANLHLKVMNAACPGETTASFLNTAAQSNGCENSFDTSKGLVPGGYRTNYPLHTKYKNAGQSQLAFAEAYLEKHPQTRLVSLMIGANDGFLCLDQTTDGCISEFGALQATITKNVGKILKGIRKTAHYNGQIVLVSYYATDYSNGESTFESQGLNTALENAAKGYHVEVADGYGQYQLAAEQGNGSLCSSGLLTALSGDDAGTCGVHPSIAGQALLAQAVEQAIKH